MLSGQDDPTAFLEELNSGTIFPALNMKPGFDCRTADKAELEALGLPACPDETADRVLWNLWMKFFTPGLVLLTDRFYLQEEGRRQSHVRQSFATRCTCLRSNRQETSLNWSGAYVTATNGRRFHDIYGIWTVPEVTAPAGADRDYFSSIFIGFDGQRRYVDASLPQIGTRQDVTLKGGIRYETWWEWFARGQFNWPVRMPLSVQPGQSVLCWMTVMSPRRVRFMMKNLDTNQGLVFIRESPEIPLAGSTFRPRVSGATAEWVVERPTGPTGDFEQPPGFAGVTFDSCVAVASGDTAGTRVQDLTGTRLIHMVEARNTPSRTMLIAEARQRASQSLRVSCR